MFGACLLPRLRPNPADAHATALSLPSPTRAHRQGQQKSSSVQRAFACSDARHSSIVQIDAAECCETVCRRSSRLGPSIYQT
eukprot:gene17730-biopygen20400